MQNRNIFTLSALSMGLIHGSISLGLIIVNLRGSGKSGNDPALLLHFVLALLVGLGLCLVAKKKRRIFQSRSFAVLTGLAGLFCAVLPLLPGDLPMRIFDGHPPIVSILAALFLPLGLALFFRAAPRGREGFFYGIVMALGELVWVTLFPLFPPNGGAGGDPAASGLAFHLFTLSCLTLGCAGLCMSVALYQRGAQRKPAQDAPLWTMRAALLWIFGAGAGIFFLLGLEMGMSMPKTALAPRLIALPHILPLFFLPLVGWMLDGENPGKLMLLLIPAYLSAPLFGLAHTNGLLDAPALFCLLAALRQILLLVIFTASVRLMKSHALLPLLLTLAYCLHLMQPGGVILRGQLASLPHGVFAAALVLAAATAFCLWRFRRLLQEGLWALPALPADNADDVTAKIHAFAAAHKLSGREQELLVGMIQGASLEKISLEMGVALSTVRYHLTGLLKKTGISSQRNLLSYFARWRSEQS
ncbi:hypothetical protein FACS1894205_4690 [Alphaproteobacteria bacterium]|nr:hypothetical protein FACS1894205_4690 [Alphaproteobacteria bacterium]